MKILFVCATREESVFLSTIDQESLKQELPVILTPYKNLEIALLVTGVGMLSTCYFLQKELLKHRYDLVLNVGLAGSFKGSVALGTVFKVESDCIAELGAEDDQSFISVFELGLQNGDSFPFLKGRLIPTPAIKSKVIDDLPAATSITVNKVHGNERSISEVTQLFNTDLETMEGAAFFYVCMMEKIPCLQLRAVSNLIERRNRTAWNIPLALSQLEVTLKNLLAELAENKI